MEHVTDNSVISETANQNLGGKELRFPYYGMSSLLESTKYGNSFTPSSVNVILRHHHNKGMCGGTRPGLRAYSGSTPAYKYNDNWMWPDGDKICWPGNNNYMVFAGNGHPIVIPEVGTVLDQHETFNINATKGEVPEGCTVMAMYRDRLVVAKESMWYASRTGDVGDFDYGGISEDLTRPAAGNVALAGKQGEEITALAAVKDLALIVATRRSLWMFNGEVTQQMSLISDNIGIISKDAWCYDGNKFWFWGNDGLYAMALGSTPENVTRQLKDLVTGWDKAVLIFDSFRNGIHIIGTYDSDNASDWFYDIENGAMWKLKYYSGVRPVSGGSAIIDGKNTVLFYCADNVFRYWEEEQETDDGTSFSSALTLGPITHTTGNTEDSFLAELDFEFDDDYTSSSGVNVSGIIGTTSNKVIDDARTFISWVSSGASGTESTESFRYSITPGWNSVVRPRVRCNSAAFVAWSTQGRFVISKITAVQRGCGRVRR